MLMLHYFLKLTALLLLLQETYSFRRQIAYLRLAPALYSSPVTSATSSFPRLTEFLQACSSLQDVRFVVVGPGAILETLGSFDGLRYSETQKGLLATVSADEPLFECHIRLAEVKEVKMLTVTRPLPGGGGDGKPLYVTRFLSSAGETLLSSILHGDGNISSWNEIKRRFCSEGDSFKLS